MGGPPRRRGVVVVVGAHRRRGDDEASSSSARIGAPRAPRRRARRAAALAAACAAAALVGGALPGRRRSATVALAASKGTFSMTGIVPRPFVGEVYAADEKMLTEEEAWEALQAADFKAHCDNVTYAFCGRSTCRLNGEKAVATCGCKLIKASAGSIGFNSKNAYLIRSKIVRKALYEATVLNSSTSFVNTVCGAIESRRLWRDAGFDSDFGSFSDPGYPGYWAMIDLDCDSSGSIDYNFADCDGAPCDIEQGFNLCRKRPVEWPCFNTAPFDANYDSMCVCPYVAANRSYVIHEYITDATATSCPELMTGLGDCAIQKTLSRNAMMTTRADTLEVYADLKSASFLSAGTECPTVSFNNVSTMPTWSPTASHPPTAAPTTGAPSYAPTYCPTLFPTLNPALYPAEPEPRAEPRRPRAQRKPVVLPERGADDSRAVRGAVVRAQRRADDGARPLGRPPEPTVKPTYRKDPTAAPSIEPSPLPSPRPTYRKDPTGAPSFLPSPEPSVKPSDEPSAAPSYLPTLKPTHHKDPTAAPSIQPSPLPTLKPTHHKDPTAAPSYAPTAAPTLKPTHRKDPTAAPSGAPTSAPTLKPTHRKDPTAAPSDDAYSYSY
ncbi:hypothetical protein JL721_7547 [Aureococcus anophagefferens]|nr:hypothetical protein JL721_7547 [Aureococcus anophagefferens]